MGCVNVDFNFLYLATYFFIFVLFENYLEFCLSVGLLLMNVVHGYSPHFNFTLGKRVEQMFV